MARRKISEILAENNLPSQVMDEEVTREQPNLVKTALAGLTSGLVSTAPMVAGGLASLPEIGYHSLRGLFDKDYETGNKVLETLGNSKLMQLGGKLDEETKKLFGIDDITNLDKEHQAALMLGDWAPVIASAGSYGLLKVGQKAMNKTLKNATKKALAKGLEGQAKKKFIKRRAFWADTATGLAIPGVQVSKNSSKLGKLFQISLQTVPSIGMNEYVQAKNNNEGLFGDYREPESDEVDRVVLFDDKRKLRGKEYLDELKSEDYAEYEIKKQQEEESHLIRNTLMGAAAVGAALTGAARYTKKGQDLVEQVLKKSTEPKVGVNDLSLSEQFTNNAINKYSFLDKMQKEGIVNEEDVNALYRDDRNFANNAYINGKIGADFDFGVKPAEIDLKIKALKENNPVLYKNFEDFLELARQAQYNARSFNIKNGVDASTMDYLDTNVGSSFKNLFSDLSNKQAKQRLTDLYANLRANSLTREIIDDLDILNTKYDEYRLAHNLITRDTFEQNKRNHLLFGKMIYKHGTEDLSNLSNWDRFKNYLNKNANKSKDFDYIEAQSFRGTDNTVTNAASFLDSFEQNFKEQIYALNKTITRSNVLQHGTENISNIVNKTIADFKIEFQDKFIEQYNKLKWDENFAINSKDFAKADKIDKEIKELQKQFIDDLNKTRNFLVHTMAIKKVGSSKIRNTMPNSIDVPYDLTDDLVGDRSNYLYNRMFRELKNQNNELSNLAKSTNRAGIIPDIQGDEIVYYHMDPYFARALTLDPQITNKFAQAMFMMKNFNQSVITGKYNPFFSPTSGIMTTEELATATPKLAEMLKLKDVRIRDYMKELLSTGKALYSKHVKDGLVKEYTRRLAKYKSNNFQPGTTEYLNNEAQIKVLDDELNQILNKPVNEQTDLINEIYKSGVVGDKPINVMNDRGLTLTSKFKLTDKLQDQLYKIHGERVGRFCSNLLYMFTDLLRDTPNLSMYSLLVKNIKKQRGLKTLNNQIFDEIAKVMNTTTANNTIRGSEEGLIGATSGVIRNYLPYGNIAINSIAPKMKAIGISKGAKELKQLGKELLDKDVKYVDILNHMQQMAKDVGSNNYIKGLFFVAIVPSILEYVWNHANQDNINSFYSFSDYRKGSKLIFSNFFGKGNHLVIPTDQEVNTVRALNYAILDNMLGMSKYNPNDPAYNANNRIFEALSRSFGLDVPNYVKVLANSAGYNVDINLGGRDFISKLPQNQLNNDLSETAYMNGIASQEATSIVNDLFGVLGSALLGAAEEGKVGHRNNTGINDFISAFMDKTFGNIGLIQTDSTRNTNLATKTIQDVYSKREVMRKIASVKDKNPQQQQVYELIKNYNRNRIIPIQEQISLLRKDLNNIRANSKTADGQTSSYYSRKAKMNELNDKLQQLYKNEYEEYNKLDSLIQQLYGNNITIESFMPQYNTGE